MPQTEIKINQNRAYNSGRDALNFLGYKYLGTATLAVAKNKQKTLEVYELEGKRFTMVTCKIVRYRVVKLIVSDYDGKTDQEISLEPAATE